MPSALAAFVTYCCDLIIASDRAEWRLPQVALGILPNHGGIVRLARWVGKGQAMKVAMGYPMTAEEAFRFGLAQWLVPHDELILQTRQSLIGPPSCRRSPRGWLRNR